MRNAADFSVVLLAVIVCGCGSDSPATSPVVTSRPALVVHPVFHTFVSGESAHRPAIQVDILDASRGWFSTAKLYVAVQSSRFPAETWVILPVNVGDFAGCRTRFVQLPFEVNSNDTIVFNLLDDIRMTPEEEQRVMTGCRVAGYCILHAGSLYAPAMKPLLVPTVDDVAVLLGKAFIDDMNMRKFQNFGTAEYIASNRLPESPHQANRLTLLDDANYARIQLRIYGPPNSLQLENELQPAKTAAAEQYPGFQ